ncbi:MAG: acetyl-CoA C-acetyltransferase [Fibrobacteria bacterium]|nr:acetyl-CoA C-acetyltransferase [Fibrobacteria bacterium]
MRNVYIVSARRTAIGTFGGSLKDVSAVELGSVVVKAILSETGVPASAVSEVILGNVLGAGLGQNVARQVTLSAGLPQEVPAFTLNKVCGSGLKAVQLAAQSIATGEAEIVIAGGTENMDQAPYVMPAAARSPGLRMGNAEIVDTMIKDGLWCASNDYHMGITAENVAKKYGITREAQDAFALESQKRAQAAIQAGVFKDEIVPVLVKERKETRSFEVDEHPRATSAEALAKLRPAFDKAGTVTAGNASGINDGAAILMLASEEAVKAHGLKPLARVVGFAAVGLEPAVMGYGPVPAVKKLMERSGRTLDQIERFELNEAFASQALAVAQGLGLESRMADINRRGGAIALGHPIGASGARILVSLVHGMLQDGQSNGVAALCIGGGQGIAAMIEKV